MNDTPHVFDNTFDITPTELQIEIGGKPHTLREADGLATEKYNAARLTGARMSFNDDQGTRTVSNLGAAADTESLLVSLCLFDDKGKNVPQKVVRSWPARVQGKLFEMAKEISHIDVKEDLQSLLKQRDKLDAKIRALTGVNGDEHPDPTTGLLSNRMDG